MDSVDLLVAGYVMKQGSGAADGGGQVAVC